MVSYQLSKVLHTNTIEGTSVICSWRIHAVPNILSANISRRFWESIVL